MMLEVSPTLRVGGKPLVNQITHLSFSFKLTHGVPGGKSKVGANESLLLAAAWIYEALFPQLL